MSRFFFFFYFLLILFTLLISASSHGAEEHEDEDEPTYDLRSRSLILVKVECLIIIFVLTLISGVSPFFLKWSQGFLVLGTQFAGGVFLGTALMHFLSDADETFKDLTSKEYPFAYMLACVGYLLTMLADCIVTHVFSKQQRGLDSNGDLELQGGMEQSKGNQNNVPCIQASNGSINPHTSSTSANRMSSLGDSVLLIIALCFHSIFEGIAIGVSETKADAWRALWTITLHKIFAAIAMGIALLRMIPDRPFFSCVAYSLAFAISSPIGIAIGIIIDATAEGPVADWIFAVSMGLACGVFVYVSVNHLLAKGYSPSKKVLSDTAFCKFLAVLLGIGVMAVVMIWDT